MKTTVIPAQITTVEDRIAGNLNLTQMILLIIPILWTMVVYILLFPTMHFVWYKLPLVLVVLLISLTLALRVKGKVVLHLVIILINYNLRPKYYLFNKNESSLRVMDLPTFERTKISLLKKTPAKQEKTNTSFGVKDLIQLEQFIKNPNYSFSLKSAKKGGLYVALEQIQKYAK